MLILKRTYWETHTSGTLYLPDGSLRYSLELPDKDNLPFLSCVPEGDYIVDRNTTGAHQYYSLKDVPNRSHIEIHPANRVTQLEGCIAFGKAHMDGQLFRSKDTCDELLKWFGDASWVLRITS
ncbi:DUF5675 family protein [Salinimonas marina]|uniref:DUF5675 family protein n=1 Tax=Salinimonas marina TaxID=2785918 RepID=UPI0038CD1900